MSSCRILDDEELELEQSKPAIASLDKTQMREWTHAASTKPFEANFIKTTPFPRAFKTYHINTVSTQRSTTSLVEKVKNLMTPSDNMGHQMGP